MKEWTGRISAQSLNSELKMATPPGDEIWAQKCHELDFQVVALVLILLVLLFQLRLLKLFPFPGGSP